MAFDDPELNPSAGTDNGQDWFIQNSPSAQGAAAYYGPMAPGVIPGPGEGDAAHNPGWDPYQNKYDFAVDPEALAKYNRGDMTKAQLDALQAARAGTGATGGNTGDGYGTLNRAYGGLMPSVGDYTPPPFEYDAFKSPDPFAPPSAQSVLDNDPGYDFRLGQGKQALEQSAAARGTLNTGGTLQDLVNYGQSFASNEYANAYQRALGTYQTNFTDALNSYITNFGGALTKYNTNYGTQYLTPWNQLMQQYGVNNSNYQNAQDRSFNQQFATATA